MERSFGSARGDFVLPSERVQTVELSTVHKAKGLGWQVVYLLEPNELPLEFVIEQGGWQARQERNVQYVAYTRSTRDLIFLKNVIPHPKPEGFSLHDALKEVLWGEEEGAEGASTGPRAHPSEQWQWSAEGAFHGWREFSQQQQQREAAGEAAGEAEGEAALAAARLLLQLSPPPAQLTEREVDLAYRRMALQLHPDRCDAADATARMQAVVEARDLLKDALQRDAACDSDGE